MARHSTARRSRQCRGAWRPAALAGVDVTVIIAGLCTQALVRSFDYAYGPEGTGWELISAVAPPTVWAVALTAGALLLGTGAVWARHRLVWWGHGVLAILYVLLLVGVGVSAATRQHFEGVRAAAVLIAPVLLHGLLWLRTGQRPSPLDRDGVV